MYLGRVGMICPVGLNAAASCAAMRAGISRFAELPYQDDRRQPYVGGMVPGLDAAVRGRRRLVEMLTMALGDALGQGDAASLSQVPLLVAVAEPERPGVDAASARHILAEVQQRLGWHFHPTLSQVIPGGHTAAFEALRVSRGLFQRSGVSRCVLCGVDSYIDAKSLRWLNQQGRLKTEDRSNGAIPGECAAVVEIHRQSPSPALPALRVLGLGFAVERAAVLSEEPLMGLGLAQAARAALNEAGLQLHEIAFRVSDVTGELYGFKEQALVVARLLRTRREELPLWHCADAIGDTGAAAGVAQLVRIAQAWTKDYAPGDRAMCFTSAVSGARAVAVVSGPGG